MTNAGDMQRKVFLAAAALAAIATDACAQSAPKTLEMVESKAEFNYAAFAKLVGASGDVHHCWDVDGYEPDALGAMKSGFNGYQFGFGIAPSAIKMAAVLHGVGAAFAYDDSMWAKYKIGATFGVKDPSGNVVPSNIFYHARSQQNPMTDPNDPTSMYQDATLEALQRRGLMVFVCHTAIAEQARTIARNSGGNPQDILVDILAHLMPGVVAVPSGVATVGLLQNRFHYAYTQTTS